MRCKFTPTHCWSRWPRAPKSGSYQAWASYRYLLGHSFGVSLIIVVVSEVHGFFYDAGVKASLFHNVN